MAREPYADDTIRALGLWTALGGIDTPRAAVILGPPERKQRPRLGGDHVYAPDAEAEEMTAGKIVAALSPRERQMMLTNVALVLICYRQDARTIDADNLAKHVMDAGNGVLWLDDVQVTGLAVLVELDRAHPRTVIVFGRHVSTMARGVHKRPRRVGVR